MNTPEYKQNLTPPRLAVDIRPDQRDELMKLLPWGIKKRVFECIIDDLIVILKSDDRDVFLGGLLNRSISMTDFVRTKEVVDRG